MLKNDRPSPRYTLDRAVPSQKGGTTTTPSIQIFFSHTYVTHPPIMTPHDAAQRTGPTREFALKLGRC